MAVCNRCGATLTGDDIGAHKKLINRGATTFMCIDCLAKTFGCSRSLIEEKIRHFKKMGCTLFVS